MDRILGDQNFVDDLLEEYKQLKDLCLEYIEKRFKPGQGGLDGPIGFGKKAGSPTAFPAEWGGTWTAPGLFCVP